MKIFFLAIFIVFGLSTNCFSEIYKDLVPYKTLKELREAYPTATFTEIVPAWAKEDDIMYSLEGIGIPGKLVLMLIDDHKFFQNFCITRNTDEINTLCDSKLSDPENMIWLNWTRWIPAVKIPLKKLTEKYGKATFTTDDYFHDYAEWNKRKISALLTNDKIFVEHVNFHFTDDEYEEALKN